LSAAFKEAQEIGIRTSGEGDKIIEVCELPDRSKPEGEIEEIKVVSQLCGKAVSLPKPSYPAEARAAKVSGRIQVDVVIDEKGRVVWAKAVAGHPMLRDAARKAACRARYSPAMISGRPIKTETIINYNFAL
jgi:protein TonB